MEGIKADPHPPFYLRVPPSQHFWELFWGPGAGAKEPSAAFSNSPEDFTSRSYVFSHPYIILDLFFLVMPWSLAAAPISHLEEGGLGGNVGEFCVHRMPPYLNF